MTSNCPPKSQRIISLPGDGIGPEVSAAAIEVLSRLAPDITVETRLIGGCSIDAHGEPLTADVVQDCLSSDAVLLGAVGGPKWGAGGVRPEQGLLDLRQALGAFANLRPIHAYDALVSASTLREDVIKGVDFMVVRELTGGIYFGERRRDANSATDVCTYTRAEIERIARVAFAHARERVTSVDKANVLETSRLWREVVEDVHAREFPEIELEHLLADAATMRLVSDPRSFDVLLTENLFGDLLSDEASMLTGSIGLLPSASLGTEGSPGLFEPVHGSAPDIAGKGIANPLAMFGSVAMMLRSGLDREAEAERLERAIEAALVGGLRTFDLGGSATTEQATESTLAELEDEPVSAG